MSVLWLCHDIYSTTLRPDIISKVSFSIISPILILLRWRKHSICHRTWVLSILVGQMNTGMDPNMVLFVTWSVGTTDFLSKIYSALMFCHSMCGSLNYNPIDSPIGGELNLKIYEFDLEKKRPKDFEKGSESFVFRPRPNSWEKAGFKELKIVI